MSDQTIFDFFRGFSDGKPSPVEKRSEYVRITLGFKDREKAAKIILQDGTITVRVRRDDIEEY